MQLLTIVLSCCLVANYSQVTVPLLCETWQQLNKLTIVLSSCLVANYSQVTVPLLCEILAATQQASHCPFLLPLVANYSQVTVSLIFKKNLSSDSTRSPLSAGGAHHSYPAACFHKHLR
jgi:hypothetical protein